MAARLVVVPEAEFDISDAYDWYEGRRTGLGEEFLTQLMRAWKASAVDPQCTLWFMKLIAEP